MEKIKGVVKVGVFWERYEMLNLLINDFKRDLRRALRLVKKEKKVYSPYAYMYDKFNSELPQRPKSKARRRLENFIIVIMGLLCLWILWIDKGVVR